MLVRAVAPELDVSRVLRVDDVLLSAEGQQIGNDGSIEFVDGERIQVTHLINSKCPGRQEEETTGAMMVGWWVETITLSRTSSTTHPSGQATSSKWRCCGMGKSTRYRTRWNGRCSEFRPSPNSCLILSWRASSSCPSPWSCSTPASTSRSSATTWCRPH